MKSRLVGSDCRTTQSLPYRSAESLLSETGVPGERFLLAGVGKSKDLRLPFVGGSRAEGAAGPTEGAQRG
jgi:hypothetical protein